MKTVINDLKLEVATIPVSDVERAKHFYAGLGWKLDAEISKGDAFRVLQFTPPGSPASIHFGTGVTSAAPGTAQSYLVVSDIVAARAELVGLGVEVSDVFHRSPGEPARTGPHPQRQTYSSYATFRDPDGNTWLLQEVTRRLPGRVSGNTAFASSHDLGAALRRAAAAHGAHEKSTGGKADENWPDWYADYLVREQSGEELPA
jgi:catechol 2,3-dioxygenase-like lactoylglutathione lyase family enzyme